MSETNSSSARSTAKPDRPPKPDRPDGSPLFWHASGRWAKKVRGRTCYFGRGSHDDALAEYNRVAADLHSGRQPRDEESGGITVKAVCTKFLTAKLAQRDAGELSPRSYVEYGQMVARLVKAFGRRPVSDLRPGDFAKLRAKMAASWGAQRLKSEVIRSRTPFLWAVKQGLIDRPPMFGDAFGVPSASVLRRHRAKQGPKMFEADEVHKLLAAATQPLRSMVLLALNCAFGNGDIGQLPIDAVDLESGWVRFPRPKTGIDRKCPLWPETVQAIRDWIAVRPTPTDPGDADLLFTTSKRGAWRTDGSGRSLSHEFQKLMRRAGLNGGRGFYCLRHTFATVGDGTRDFVAVRSIMGHTFGGDITAVYRERIDDERLQAVTDHLRKWLLAVGPIQGGETVPDVLPFASAV
jgi:integrase